MAGDFRVTTYEIKAGEFTGTSYTLVLDNDLSSNYFCMISPAGPSESGSAAVRVNADPFGTGHLSTTSALNELELIRYENLHGDWIGNIIVIECINNSSTAGFTLLDVIVTDLPDGSSNNSTTSVSTVSSVTLTENTVPFGGIRGGGVTANQSTVTSPRIEIFAKFDIDVDTNELIVTRWNYHVNTVAPNTFTTYLIDWGSDWNVQKVDINGFPSNEFVQAQLPVAVNPTNTWGWLSGYSSAQNEDGWQSLIFALGSLDNAEFLQTQETDLVYVSNGYNGVSIQATLFCMENPNIFVEQYYTGGNISTKSGTITNLVPPAVPETYTNTGTIHKTSGERFNLNYSSLHRFSSSYLLDNYFLETCRNTSSTTVEWERPATTYPFRFVNQTVDFAGGDTTYGQSEASSLLSQVEYSLDGQANLGSYYQQIDYDPISRIHVAGLLIQVEYVPPPEQVAIGSVALQTEVEYEDRSVISSVALQVEYEGAGGGQAGDETRLFSAGLQSSLTTGDSGSIFGIGLQSAPTAKDGARLYSQFVQNSMTAQGLAYLNSLAQQSANTSAPIAHLNSLYLQVAITVSKDRADEDIQGEYFQKRFKSFYKR